MLKRCLALLLCLLMLPAAALAEGGILPELPTRDAISFAQVTGAEPLFALPVASESILDTHWVELYADVTPEQYYAFSAALAENGFELVTSEADGWEITAQVRSSTAEMEIYYYCSVATLVVSYIRGIPATPETVPDTLEEREALFALLLPNTLWDPEMQISYLQMVLRELFDTFGAALPSSPQVITDLEETFEFLQNRLYEYNQTLIEGN